MPLPCHRGHIGKRRFASAPVRCMEGRRGGCRTWCCRDLLVLVAREDLDDGLETEPGFLDLLRMDDQGGCAYLDAHDGCSVWEKRPLDCRVFSCEGRERPGLLKPSRHESPAGLDASPLASTACAHCGETAGFVVRFVWRDHRVRCMSCGGPFLPRVIRGRPLRLRVDPSDRSEGERFAQRAETREYLGDLPGALADFSAAAVSEPTRIDPALGRLRVAIRIGDEDAITDAFEEARHLDETRAWLEGGLAHEVRGRHDEARLALRRAEALGASSTGLTWAMARAERAAGRPEAAVARLAIAARASGNDVRIVQDLLDLAREGVPGARAAVVASGDRRGMAALGLAGPLFERQSSGIATGE